MEESGSKTSMHFVYVGPKLTTNWGAVRPFLYHITILEHTVVYIFSVLTSSVLCFLLLSFFKACGTGRTPYHQHQGESAALQFFGKALLGYWASTVRI